MFRKEIAARLPCKGSGKLRWVVVQANTVNFGVFSVAMAKNMRGLFPAGIVDKQNSRFRLTAVSCFFRIFRASNKMNDPYMFRIRTKT